MDSGSGGILGMLQQIMQGQGGGAAAPGGTAGGPSAGAPSPFPQFKAGLPPGGLMGLMQGKSPQGLLGMFQQMSKPNPMGQAANLGQAGGNMAPPLGSIGGAGGNMPPPLGAAGGAGGNMAPPMSYTPPPPTGMPMGDPSQLGGQLPAGAPGGIVPPKPMGQDQMTAQGSILGSMPGAGMLGSLLGGAG